jgi:hypothetical protein
MTQYYNPIIRSFARLRAILVSMGLPRSSIRPDAELESLVPLEMRREIWSQIQSEDSRIPGLDISKKTFWVLALFVLVSMIALVVCLRTPNALFVIIPLGFIAREVSRPWAVHFPSGIRTMGELKLFVTRFEEHRDSGYRWTRNEISFKVRMIVADAFGVPLDEARPETTLAELGAD